MPILSKLKNLFLPDQMTAIRRRMKAFGTTDTGPVVTRAIIAGATAGAGAKFLPRLLSRGASATSMASGAAGAVGSMPSVARAPGFLGRVSNVAKTAYGRLFAPVSAKGFAGAVGSAGFAAGALGLGKYATSGKASDLATGPRTFAGLLALRFSPIAGTFGLIEGAGVNVARKIKDIGNNAKDFLVDRSPGFNGFAPNLGGAPQGPTFNVIQPPALDFGAGNFATPAFGGASASYAPSVSPSVSVGGLGGPDYSTMLLLASLGLLGGYALGKRKRKKRKSKKRKRKK